MPEPWRFRCRIEARGTCAIKPWLKGISKKARAKLDAIIEHLAAQPKDSWSRPKACSLGNHIYVIHLQDETRKQHRIFGHFANDEQSFVMTLDGFEKDDTYHPSDYDTKAARHRNTCNSDTARYTRLCLCLDPKFCDHFDPANDELPEECRTCTCPGCP